MHGSRLFFSPFISNISWREQTVSDLYLLAPWEIELYLGVDGDEIQGDIGQYCQSFY